MIILATEIYYIFVNFAVHTVKMLFFRACFMLILLLMKRIDIFNRFFLVISRNVAQNQ